MLENKYLCIKVEKKLSSYVMKSYPKKAQKYPDTDSIEPDESRICLLPEPSTQWAWGSPGPACPPVVISQLHQ